ncbi:MAG: hypothetical protein RBU27_03055 [Bacteroidota bacterium]|jgi:energy-converting hydrogenase Eha subunit A|nr:hypothetical protein [Bacteroidota bacterium]
MIDRGLRRFGVDPVQFRALLRTTLKVDFRAGMIKSTVRKPGKRRFPPMLQLALFHGFLGLVLSALVIANANLFLTATLLIGVVMFSIATSVLVEFQAVIIQPEDYEVLAPRPVSSRTYFAARMANLLAYLGVTSTAIGLFPSLVYTFRNGFQPQLGAAILIAILGAAVMVSLLVIFFYVHLMRVVHPKKLLRVFSYLQLLQSFLVYGSGMVFSMMLDHRIIQDLELHMEAWMLVLPPVWFSSLVPLAAGEKIWLSLAALLTGAGVIALLGMYVHGRLSLEYAALLARQRERSERRAPSTAHRPSSVPLFGRGEARAAALLIRNQFKYDIKFRLPVLAIVPLTILYLLTGLSSGGGLADPFVSPAEHVSKTTLLYFALAFFPVLLMAAMVRSDSWQASWIFHATPSDKGNLVLAMKDVLMVLFVLPYVLALGILFAVYFNSIQHVVVHVLILALLSHCIMQLLVMANPHLPFSRPLRKGERSSGIFVGIIIAAVGMTATINLLARWIYTSPVGTGATLVSLAVLTIIFEKLAARRVRRKAADFQFTM